MLVRNPEEEKREKEKTRKPFKVSRAEWYDDFIRNRRIIQTSLHILHPAIRLVSFLPHICSSRFRLHM
jgi:hypothetical protein